VYAYDGKNLGEFWGKIIRRGVRLGFQTWVRNWDVTHDETIYDTRFTFGYGYGMVIFKGGSSCFSSASP
jgi:hypothetical protein